MDKKETWATAADAILAKSSLGEKERKTAKKILGLIKESKDGIRELEKSFSAPDHINALKGALDNLSEAMAGVLSVGAKRTLKMHYCLGTLINLTTEDELIAAEIEELIRNS